ncbi:MAG TPA: hypothetical protein PLV53_02035, partial [Anaerolineaceae bacterium]|nr:hypothetical protein [Anaerolineaceae bacterium]
VGRGVEDRRLVNALSATILTVFPSLHVVDVPDSFNTILFATRTPTEPANLRANFDTLLARPDTPRLLLEAMATALTNLQPVSQSGPVFTDDYAPVEWITNAMILDFFLTGDMEEMQ